MKRLNLKGRSPRYLASAALLALSLSACGGTAYQEVPISDTDQDATSSSTDAIDDSASLDGGEAEASGELAPIGWDANLTGYSDSETYGGSISSESILKVTLSIDSQGVIPNTGYDVAVGCMKVSVTALGYKKTVTIRAESPSNVYGYGSYESSECKDAETNPELDFSTYLNSGGNSGISVKLSEAYYDNCHNYGLAAYYAYLSGVSPTNYSGCPINKVYSTHQVGVSLQIHTNGTY
jgi:hypothetical protein